MNDPISNTSTALELPGIVASAVQQVVSDSRGLGLTWALRIATVSTTSPLAIIYDGDTQVINAVSMIGPLAPLQRVYSLMVPPSGNFIVGCLNTTLGNMGANVCSLVGSAIITTPAGGAETAVPSGTWNVEPNFSFDPDTIYKATITGFVNESTGAGAVCFIRLRRGSATIIGNQLGLVEMFTPAGFGGLTQSFHYVMYFKNTGDVVRTKLSLTLNGVIGAGTWSFYGDNTNVPLAVVVESVGSITANPGLSRVPAL